MKNIIAFFIAFFVITLVNAQHDKFTVTVEGLGCPFCAYGLEKKFKEVQGVKSIKIDIETGLMTFTADASKNLSLESVDRQVDKAGYTAKAIKIERASGKVETSENTASASSDKSSAAKTATFRVAGNCTMCEARIEKAAKALEGVSAADWNVESKMLTVKFDEKKTSLNDIHKKIAAVGHDTDKVKAQDKAYEQLPGCCLYRKN